MEGAERRREPRLPFRADCTIELTGLHEVTGRVPLKGRAVNITEHGVMVVVPSVEKGFCDRVQGAMNGCGALPARVHFTPRPGFPPLRGQVVWTNWGAAEDLGAVCQLGLVFQIPSPPENQALQEVLAGLSTQTNLEG